MTSKGHMGAERELDEKVTETRIDIFLESPDGRNPKRKRRKDHEADTNSPQTGRRSAYDHCGN